MSAIGWKARLIACIRCRRLSGRAKRAGHVSDDEEEEQPPPVDDDDLEEERPTTLFERVFWCCKKRQRKQKFMRAPRTHEDTLRRACANGNLKEVERVLEKQSWMNVDVGTQHLWRGLHVACSRGHLQVVQDLLRRQASVNDATSGGMTPLMLASCAGHLEVCQELLRRKADPWAVIYSARAERTALDLADGFGHEELAVMLRALPRGEDGEEKPALQVVKRQMTASSVASSQKKAASVKSGDASGSVLSSERSDAKAWQTEDSFDQEGFGSEKPGKGRRKSNKERKPSGVLRKEGRASTRDSMGLRASIAEGDEKED
mmetsp:Transcript_11293/g.33460  ORF Transcript_11293/g.33460 Transcript_11293/m.33460 type:complete len:318 (-) Transcript_11293:100-1053(-)